MLVYLQMIEAPEQKSVFEQIYIQYRALMYAAAYGILGNPQDAEDAVQHAFMKIAENIKKISEPVCPKTKAYVVTIVETTAINLYRKKKRHPTASYYEEAAGITVEYSGGNDLARCMAQLPARYRQVLLLKYHHGYSTKEIAKMLGLTAANAAKIEQRAKAKLELLCKEAEIL